MALLPAVAPGLSRRGMLMAVDASVALDLIMSRMTAIYSTEGRPYPSTMIEVRKMFRAARRQQMGPVSDMDVARRSIASMAKYRKAR